MISDLSSKFHQSIRFSLILILFLICTAAILILLKLVSPQGCNLIRLPISDDYNFFVSLFVGGSGMLLMYLFLVGPEINRNRRIHSQKPEATLTTKILRAIVIIPVSIFFSNYFNSFIAKASSSICNLLGGQ